jgi:hypothetical protein
VKWWHSLFGALVLMLFCVVRAAEPPDQASLGQSEGVQPLDWLNAGSYPALEQFYSEQQRAFEAGKISDEVLFQAFRKLNGNSLDSARAFDGWVSAYPKSYAALLARGIYEYHMASAARGAKLAMAVRDRRAHYRIDEITGRHWRELAERVAIADLWPRMQALVGETPTAFERLQARLPQHFPERVFIRTRAGALGQARRFAATTAIA